MGLDTDIKKVTGYKIDRNTFSEYYKEYIKQNNMGDEFDEHEYIELVGSQINFEIDYQKDDPCYGCNYDYPYLIIYKRSNAKSINCFSIDGNPPGEPLYNDKGEELFVNEEGEYDYVLNSCERGYGFCAPDSLDLADYGIKPNKKNIKEYNLLKKQLKQFCIKLEDFTYSCFIMTYYY